MNGRRGNGDTRVKGKQRKNNEWHTCEKVVVGCRKQKLTLMENEKDRKKNREMTGRLVYHSFSGRSREAGG